MKVPDNHLESLLLYFQDGWGGLNIDGAYGVNTADALDKYIALSHEEPVTAAPSLNPMQEAWAAATNDIGQREQPLGSNGGEYVDSLRQATNLPRRGGGEWCAVFVSKHLQAAGLAVGSRGAPGIVRALEEIPGGRRVAIEDVEFGTVYLALRKRGLFTHHVQMFRMVNTLGGSVIRHVGGNEGHKVQSKLWTPSRFFKGVKKVVTYE